MMPATTDRLDFRITRETKKLIEQAATATGQSVTDFAVEALRRRAKKVLRDEQALMLSNRDRDLFLAALERPPRSNAKLRQAAKRYNALRKSGRLAVE